MDQPGGHRSQWHQQSQKDNTTLFLSYESPEKSGSQREWSGAGGCQGLRRGEIEFDGYGVSIWEDEKVLDGGDGCTTLGMRLMLLNCAPEKR